MHLEIEQFLPYLLVSPTTNKYFLFLIALVPLFQKLMNYLKDKEFFKTGTCFQTHSSITYSNGLFAGSDANNTFKAISHDITQKINTFPHTVVEIPDTNLKVIEFNSYFWLTPHIKVSLMKDAQTLEKRDKNYEVVKYTFKLYPKANKMSHIDTYLETIKKEYDRYIDSIHVKSQKLFILEPFEDGIKYSRYTQMDFQSNKQFHNLFFEGKDALLSKVDFFMKNRSKYDTLGIPYTLGMLFHGEPGTGKTSTIKALANYTKRHIIVLSTKNIHTREHLKQCLTDRYVGDFIIPFDKRLYVIEEIDCSYWEEMVKSRKQKSCEAEATTATSTSLPAPATKISITLSDLLELLDGLIETPGRMVIFTTNHPEKLDPALLRPGRVDINLNFKRLNRHDVINYYELWYGERLDPDNLTDYVYTQAELGDLFSKHSKKEAKAILHGK